MKSLLMKTAFAGLCALTASAASAGVTVNYIESDKFADLPFAPWEREQVLKGGDARLADMNYMQRINRMSDSDSLRAEKRMIDDWFNETILAKKRGS